MRNPERAASIMAHITEHGPKNVEQLAAVLHVGRDSIALTIGGLVREGRLVARPPSKTATRQLPSVYCLPGIKPKYDPMDPFGLVAKLKVSRSAAREIANV